MITGAGRGHAEAIALRFAEEGAAVSLCDVVPVTTVGGESRSEKIRAAGGKVLCFQTDVSKEDQVNKMAKETIETLGTVDISLTLSASLDRPKMSGI
ncbi:Diacetyl reductase [(S)-acetoin forming] [Geodia barretti]|uniref:Diacetyl reductase [(S)-acetoin forming] n=1 Tax=Geodia barretti TaxID=519541 RepID=A0AA35T5T0_GEOBA|nr:Diacetyl reductase [(S)-acetoin forming] [Geodia barretti]